MEVKDIVKKVRQIEIRARRKTDALLMGEFQSSLKGQGMTFSEVRKYQFGDDVRHIDWNKTARFREAYVKVMEEEKEQTLMLMVDISASMDYGTSVALKKEYIAEICATLAFSAAKNQDRVGLILYADKICDVVPPSKGHSNLLTIISKIFSTEYVHKKADFDLALRYLMTGFRRKMMVFAFSDFQDDFAAKNLRVAAKKHLFLGLGISDDKDKEMPDMGYVLLEDSETGQKVWANTSSRRWRYDYSESRKRSRAYTEEVFKNSSARFFGLDVGAPYLKTLNQYFMGQ